MQKQTNKTTERKGVGLELILTGFAVVAAILMLIVLLVYVFGVAYQSLETTADTITVTNESDYNDDVVFANQTGYLVNATGLPGDPRTFSLVAVWGSDNQSDGSALSIGGTPTAGAYNNSLSLTNFTLNSTSGLIRNATAYVFPNISATYAYVRNSDEQTATRSAQDNTTRAIPLVGILFIILAVGAVIAILVASLLGGSRGRRA